MCSLLQIWMQKSIWWWLISCRSVAEPWSLSPTSKAVPHSWSHCFCLFPWQTQAQLPRQTQLRISPETRSSESLSLHQNLQIAFPAQRQGMRSSIAVIALPACGDKFLPVAWGSCASTSGRHTSPRSVGAELWRCWQTLACSFHAFQRSLIVFDVPEKHRMILTLCYPFFTTDFGLRVHTSVNNRNLKLPLSTYCIRMRCYHVGLVQVCKMGWFSLTAAKPRTQFLMKGEI